MRTARSATLLALALAGAALAVPASANHGGLLVTGLTQDDRLVTFFADSPDDIESTVKVTGLGEGDDLATLDFRPATGGLYGVSQSDAGAKLWLIDPSSGAATQVGGPYAVAGELALDVNPVVDRLRLVSSDGTNLRLNPNDGALVAKDGTLAYAPADARAGSAPEVAGVAYTNNRPGTTTTTLYDIDAAVDQLTTQVPPNSGTLNSVGSLPGATKAGKTGFDIYTRTTDGVNWAFVSLFDKGRTTFYELDLTTGGERQDALRVAGTGTVIGGRNHVTDIAVRPAQAGR